MVGDPQLLGYQDTMPSLFGYLARWDSDRFLRKTHDMSSTYFGPDVTVFMGDNFDEGEIASDAEFEEYFQRFVQIFHKTDFSKAIFLPGDNDIGGEHGYPIKSFSTRFNNYFKGDGFLQLSFIEFFKVNAMTRERVYQKVFPHPKNLRVLLSHIPLMPTMSPLAKSVILELIPNLIISAHEHISVYMCVEPKEVELKTLKQAFSEDFKLQHINISDGFVHEILIPASSYRMGSEKIGFGAMTLEPDGGVYYTVLWLPSRLKQLMSYIFLGFLVFLILCPGLTSIVAKLLFRISSLKQR